MSLGRDISALILAAGYSTWLGSLKPLLPLGSVTILAEAVGRFRLAGVTDIRVVTGYLSEELSPVLAELGVPEIFNPDYDQGMVASVLAGVRSLEPEIAAFFLLPVDIPLVKPRTIKALLEAYLHGADRIIYPCFQGLRGHPPLIPSAFVADLPPAYPGGLQAFLSRYDDDALELEVLDSAVLLDCDTSEDYKRLLGYERRQDLPTKQECEAIWDRYHLPDQVRDHCRLVAGLAGILANHLNCAGLKLDVALAVAAGYLHDLAKGQPDHAERAAQYLADLGFTRVARVVAAHRDIEIQDPSLDESELVYLADKHIAGNRLVSLRERFQRALEKWGSNPEIKTGITKRLQNATLIENRLEAVSGISLEELIRRYANTLPIIAAAGRRQIYLAGMVQ